MSAQVIRYPARRKPRTFTEAEAVIEFLSVTIMRDGRPYRVIAKECGVSASTIAGIATRRTTWPRHTTFFPLLQYFNIKLELEK